MSFKTHLDYFYVQIPMALIAPQKWHFNISELYKFTTLKNRWIPSLDNFIVRGYNFQPFFFSFWSISEGDSNSPTFKTLIAPFSLYLRK